MMFFRYINSAGHIYSHDWIDKSLLSYYTRDIDIGKQYSKDKTSDKVTVLTLRLHNAGNQMSGKYECQVFMSMMKKDEEVLSSC